MKRVALFFLVISLLLNANLAFSEEYPGVDYRHFDNQYFSCNIPPEWICATRDDYHFSDPDLERIFIDPFIQESDLLLYSYGYDRNEIIRVYLGDIDQYSIDCFSSNPAEIEKEIQYWVKGYKSFPDTIKCVGTVINHIQGSIIMLNIIEFADKKSTYTLIAFANIPSMEIGHVSFILSSDTTTTESRIKEFTDFINCFIFKGKSK